MREDFVAAVAWATLAVVGAVATAVVAGRLGTTPALLAWPVGLAAVFAVGRVASRAELASLDRRDPAVDPESVRLRTVDLARELGVEGVGVRVIGLDVPTASVRYGWTPTVVVSDGLVQRLTGEELDAVVAHELGHVRHRTLPKVLVAEFVADYAGAVAALTLFSTLVSPWWGLVAVVAYAVARLVASFGSATAALAHLALGGFVPALVVLAARVVARREEYVADRLAGRRTGGTVLVRALSKIESAPVDPPPGLRAEEGSYGSDRSRFDALYATHPPMEARMRRLLDDG